MKKIVIAISILLLCGCKGLVHEDKTLSDYVTSHDSAHLKCAGCGELRFYAQNIKCDEIKDKEIKYYDGHTLVLSDNTIYDTIFESEKLYSNNSQCKKADLDIQVDDVFKYRYNNVSIKSGNKYYSYSMDYEVNKHNLNELYLAYDGTTSKLLKDGYSIIGDLDKKLIVLKDGNVYNVTLDEEYNVKSIDIFMSKEDYGYIKEVKMSDEIQKPTGEYHMIPYQITMLVTDTAVYNLKSIETEECLKYEDVDCEMKLEKSEIYDKYKDDIRYVGTEYTILKDGNIVNSSVFSRTFK